VIGRQRIIVSGCNRDYCKYQFIIRRGAAGAWLGCTNAYLDACHICRLRINVRKMLIQRVAAFVVGAARTIPSSHYNVLMPKQQRYTAEHASAGLDAKLPDIETWPNQFSGYEIVIDDPEFTSVCPKTGLPDFGTIALRYEPNKQCLELKSYKEYLQCYRNLGIFQENAVNRILQDVVRCAKPVWAEVRGEFRPRGGILTTIMARWPRGKNSR
jgi:7-cyano-7-deazaguanine reductase